MRVVLDVCPALARQITMKHEVRKVLGEVLNVITGTVCCLQAQARTVSSTCMQVHSWTMP